MKHPTARFWSFTTSLAVALCALAAHRAVAGDFLYQFDNVFSGSPAASTNRPWVEALFQDISPGQVRLTVSNLTLTGSETVGALYFNLNPELNPRALAFTAAGDSGGFDSPRIARGTDRFRVSGDGNYDVMLAFRLRGLPENRFTAGEFLSYDISGLAGLTASDFAWQSAVGGGTGPFYAATHILHIEDSDVSGWISSTLPTPLPSAPEPGAAGLLGLGLALWLGFHFSRRCTNASRSAQPRSARIIPRQPVPRRTDARPGPHR